MLDRFKYPLSSSRCTLISSASCSSAAASSAVSSGLETVALFLLQWYRRVQTFGFDERVAGASDSDGGFFEFWLMPFSPENSVLFDRVRCFGVFFCVVFLSRSRRLVSFLSFCVVRGRTHEYGQRWFPDTKKEVLGARKDAGPKKVLADATTIDGRKERIFKWVCKFFSETNVDPVALQTMLL